MTNRTADRPFLGQPNHVPMMVDYDVITTTSMHSSPSRPVLSMHGPFFSVPFRSQRVNLCILLMPNITHHVTLLGLTFEGPGDEEETATKATAAAAA